jgi:hypothetical protein
MSKLSTRKLVAIPSYGLGDILLEFIGQRGAQKVAFPDSDDPLILQGRSCDYLILPMRLQTPDKIDLHPNVSRAFCSFSINRSLRSSNINELLNLADTIGVLSSYLTSGLSGLVGTNNCSVPRSSFLTFKKVSLHSKQAMASSSMVATVIEAAPAVSTLSMRGHSQTDAAVINDIDGSDQSQRNDGHNGRVPETEIEQDALAPALSGTAIALIMVPLCLSVLLSSLDLTMVTPAIPAIAAEFQSSSGYIWVGGAFILGSTAVTPVWGSVADIWGRKPIMLISQAFFFAGSLMCALAPNMDAFIAGRGIQGIGASGMGILVNVIICDSFSMRDRGLYLAITSVMWAIGTAIGPVLGGVFTTRVHWRWCFWMNRESASSFSFCSCS